MNRTNLMTLAAVMLVASACAQFAAGADLCTGAVDPYDVVSEKGRFYAVAGRDNELTAEEFNATKSAPGTFRRSFDRWSEMLKFDRDGNKSMDWLEADTYRYAMRKMVLASYDTNTDGKLGGPERQTACKALASGRIRFPVKRSTPPPPPPKYRPESHKRTSHKEPSRKPPSSKSDRRHDSGPNDAERKARQEAQLREAQKKREEFEAKRKEYEAKRDLAKFDKNKDGGLDGNEAAERDKYNSEKQARMAESKKRHDDMMRKYDKNGNGRIDDNEKAAVKEAMRQESAKRAAEAKEASKKKMEEYRARREVQKFDKNKDGRLDEAESTALNEYRAKRKILMDEYLKKYDTNGDGQVSIEEKTRYRQQLEKQKRETVKRKKDPARPKPPKSKSKKKQSRKDR
jgi:Ca2+-binding EF-hand superfamily protein